ncbi:hypothetical protein HYS94_03385 [Candidatus Daviesbacteria bacterium]|nr:hypothetical protein [Candidatus Daviesbacteria bacterium]
MSNAERLNMADAIATETAEPKVVVTSEKDSYQKGGIMRWLKRGSKAQVLMKPGEFEPPTATQDSQIENVHARNQQAAETSSKREHILKLPGYDPNKEYEIRELGNAVIIVDPVTGKEIGILPRIAGGSPDIPDWITEAAKSKPLRLQEAQELDQIYSRVDRSRLPGHQVGELDRMIQANQNELNTLQREVEQLFEEASNDNILNFVINDVRAAYIKAIQPPPASIWEAQPPTGREIDLKNYQETFWDLGYDVLRDLFLRGAVGPIDIRALRAKYEGLGSYIASRAAVAIDKDLKGLPLSPSTELGDRILEGVKREHEYAESRRRARASADEMLRYSDWRERFDFDWAQNRPELRASVFAWLEKFVAHLPEATIDELNNESLTWKRNAISALEKAANRLRISEKEPFYKELKSTIEAYVEVYRGAKFLETDGGLEAATIALEEFAHNFNPKHDAIYLGNAKSAIIQAFMARNHGAISASTVPITRDTAPTGAAIETIEKPQAGDLEEFRGNIEEQAKQYAATHQLYIREADFETRIRQSNGGYSWDDVIEDLLLEDRRGMNAANALTDPIAQAEAIARVVTRTGVFQRIKERLDREDEARDGRSFAELTDDERREEIRFRIRTKMFLTGYRNLVDDIDLTTDPVDKDRKLWNWLKGYNLRREIQGHTLFFPSYWDEVRLSINRPTKLVDRALQEINKAEQMRRLNPIQAEAIRNSIKNEMRARGADKEVDRIESLISPLNRDKALWRWVDKYNAARKDRGEEPWYAGDWDRALPEDELEAMIEEVDPFRGVLRIDGLTDQEINTAIENLNWTDPAQPNFIGSGLTAEQIETAKREMLEDALFDKQQRETEAERAYNINRAYQKFLGIDARWGGMSIREINDEGEMFLKNVWEKAEEILKEKIDNEEEETEEKVAALEAALRARGGLTDAEIETTLIERRRLLRRDSTFGATLALREIGIANDLPIWNYYYYNDPQRIQTFAPLVGYTHNDKPQIIDLLDRGRREMRAVWDYLADTYMDGRVLIVRDEPNADVNENGQPKDFHQERWDRARVINEAGVQALREVFESRFMLSTSGGIEVVDLISKIGDLGIYDLLWEMGCKDFREFQGFIKRRDEVELRRQSFWNIREWRDPISYAKRLRGGGGAIVYLRGGEVKGQQREPGVLQEPMMGAYKFRDEYVNREHWVSSDIRNKLDQTTAEFRRILQEIINNDQNLSKLTEQERDKLIEVGAGVLITLIKFMDALRYKMNRAGLAPKNWKLDNELNFRHYAVELLKRVSIEGRAAILGGGEKLGEQDLGYAVQGRSPLTIKIFENFFRTSSYHILVEKDRKVFDQMGQEVKARMDTKRRELDAQPLPVAIQTKINNRRNRLRALGMGTRIDRLINRGVLSQSEIDSLTDIHLRFEMDNKRKEELKSRGVPDEEIDSFLNLNQELRRMRNQYINEELHRQFYGEWSAKLAEVAEQLEKVGSYKLGV